MLYKKLKQNHHKTAYSYLIEDFYDYLIYCIYCFFSLNALIFEINLFFQGFITALAGHYAAVFF